MSDREIQFHRQRAEDERAAASHATDPRSAESHNVLAELHHQRASLLTGQADGRVVMLNSYRRQRVPAAGCGDSWD